MIPMLLIESWRLCRNSEWLKKEQEQKQQTCQRDPLQTMKKTSAGWCSGYVSSHCHWSWTASTPPIYLVIYLHYAHFNGSHNQLMFEFDSGIQREFLAWCTIRTTISSCPVWHKKVKDSIPMLWVAALQRRNWFPSQLKTLQPYLCHHL